MSKKNSKRHSVEKIAIVGVACRFPGGASSPDSFWEILRDGKDVVTQIDSNRFGTEFYYHPERQQAGKSVSFDAGVLTDIDCFDADFFGISPREAAQMDPQQRILLELTWEALENGGQVPAQLTGEDCAVFVGIASTDYAYRRLDDLSSMDAYTMTGSTASIASNRISYLFNWQGPSVSVDTACSSSLVAIHQACQAIRHGEASMAIAGGVNMLLHPFAFIGFSKASMLSDRGRCRTFDESGDGYVRAEGAAVLFLKPLEQAEADGDPIHAVIVASGINADGKTHGMTVPGSESQAALLRQVYSAPGVDTDNLIYVEAHGTGTAVGDPLETASLGAVLGAKRSAEQPLPIGSVKTNVGHMETAAGMAGMVKGILTLQHQTLVPSLHLENPNPKIDFSGQHLQVVTELTPAVKTAGQPLVGVNSFGFGGANAHVVLEAYTDVTVRAETKKAGRQETGFNATQPNGTQLKTTQAASACPPLVLSAHSEASLRELARRYQELIQKSPDAYYDIAWNALYHRQQLSYGLLVNAQTPEKTAAALRHYLGDEEALHAADQVLENKSNVSADSGYTICHGDLVAKEAPLALVFSGNGSQWQGMGTLLLESSPVFRAAVLEVDQLFSAWADYSLLDEFRVLQKNSRLSATEVAQPLLFAFQVGVVELLRSLGVCYQATTGHSVGEVAAAWAAGKLSLPQAVRVIYERSQAQAKTRGAGRMAAVALSVEALTIHLTRLGLVSRIEIAGINSSRSLTLSGSLEDLESLQATLQQENIFFRLLDLDYAFHSHHMDGIEQDLQAVLADLAPLDQQADIAFISTVTGTSLPAEQLDARYWWQNIREPVVFGKAMEHLLDQGFQVFMEVGPHAILRTYINECLRDQNAAGLVLTTGKREQESLKALHQAAYSTYLSGCAFQWDTYFPLAGQRRQLPSYPWQKERHWYTVSSEAYDLVNRKREHPLLGYRLKDAEASWENHWDEHVIPWLSGHCVDGAVVFPAAGFIEMALAASALRHPKKQRQVIENLEIHAPIVLDANEMRSVRFVLQPTAGDFQIYSRIRLSDEAWTKHVSGRLSGLSLKNIDAIDKPVIPVLQQQAQCHLQADSHYQLTRAVGLDYQGLFQGLEQVWVDDHNFSALLQLKAELLTETAQLEPYSIAPFVLDTGFQVLVDIFREHIENGQRSALIPIQMGQLHWLAEAAIEASPPVCTHIYARLKRQSGRSVVADFWLLDGQGELIAQLSDCRFRRMQFAATREHWPATYQFVPHLQAPQQGKQADIEVDIDKVIAETKVALSTEVLRSARTRHYSQVNPLLEVLATAYAWEAVAALWQADPEQALVFAENHWCIPDAWKVAETQLAFLHVLLGYLKEDGLIAESGNGWRLMEGDLPPAHDIWLAVLGDAPAYLPELVLAGRCGEQLVAILQGDVDASALLQVSKSRIQDHWRDSAPTWQMPNESLIQTVQALAEQWPQQQRLRVLELGGDNLALTQQLLSVLPAERVDYVWAGFQVEQVEQAESIFAEEMTVSTVLLDENLRDENSKKLQQPVQAFDCIISGNALQLYSAATVRRLQRFLRSGGVWLSSHLQESRFLNLLKGGESQWWSPLKNQPAYTSTLLQPTEWENILQRNGFSTVKQVFEPWDDYQQGGFINLAIASDKLPAVVSAPASHASLEQPIVAASWLLMVGDGDFSQALAQRLGELLLAQDQLVHVHLASTALESLTGFDHVIYLGGLDPLPGTFMPESGHADTLPAPAGEQSVQVLQLLQTCAGAAAENKLKLWLVTAGATPAVSFDTRLIQPEQATLWGLGRVAMNEHPELSCTLVDLQEPIPAEQAASLLLNEVLYEAGEEAEVLLSRQSRHVMRLQKKPLSVLSAPKQDESLAVCLDFSVPGPLKNLYWRRLAEQSLQPDEIEIRPLAVGLNFRDVMYAMGLLSDEAVENGFAGASLGMELAGTVVRTGSAVQDFKAGEEVLGFAPACFSTSVITRTTAVSHKPGHWSDAEAATVPTTFFTVYYALQHLAQLQAGERILIHGASGGVGLAAIQFARYRGAEVFATAGTEEKRDFVRLMGADHVLDSRSLQFAETIKDLTAGEGVDVVLNSISGEAIHKNLSILRPFGRFLELGKRDFYENSKIGLRPFRNNISYFGIDADQLLIERPELAGRLFKEMMLLFREGVLRPLPHRVFGAQRIQEAFRYMQQSSQIGKVVVSFAGVNTADLQPTNWAVQNRPQLSLSAEASYLVTGGLSGFGLRSAVWLAERGAKYLALLSRSGQPGEEAEKTIRSLQQNGVTIAMYACDVADSSALETTLNAVRDSLPPLRGVIHAAMVLEDGLIAGMQAEALRKVLAPKMLGAWNLHQLSQQDALDFMVLYSSVTTYLGNPGQANYVAANMYLESLTHYRRIQGLPAQYVAWGALDDTGYLARNHEVKEVLQARLGGVPLTSGQALKVLEQLILADVEGAAVIDMDWQVVQRFMPAARSPRFSEQQRQLQKTDEGDADQLVASLLSLPAAEAQQTLSKLLVAEVSQILRLPQEKVPLDKSVFALGMDSLMGMELVLAIEERFGVRLPVMALTEGASIQRIAEKIHQALTQDQTGQTMDNEALQKQTVAAVVKQHGSHMSEAELEQLSRRLAANEEPSPQDRKVSNER